MAVSVGIWSAATYSVQQHVVAALLKPAHHQQFIYTSVGGGVDFLFRVCIYMGVALSIPVIVYQILKYIEPLIKKDAIRFITWASVASGFLAFAGMAFGYFIGLPAALHFLLHQFTTDQIHPLLTIQSYMGFVTMYMVGAALLFQLPLIIITTNRIKPLKPSSLFRYERWVILLAFIGGGLMNPSPRLQDQLLLSGPVILTYQLGIFLVWIINRKKHRPSEVAQLMEQDEKARQERLARFQQAQAAARQTIATQTRSTIRPQPPKLEQLPPAKKDPATPLAPPQSLPSAASAAPRAVIPARPQTSTKQLPTPRPAAIRSRQTRYLNDVIGRRQAYTRLREDVA